ncbi:hypothetical protein ABLT44_05400 [Acinetobacter johnsonii]|uniref:hypothetical protein n=1 Tax=Acinetobacter johnsonii TaxID=40214 RepID=UPI0032B5A4E5
MSKNFLYQFNWFLIAFSLIATVINPYLGGITLYLWFFLIFFDFSFIQKLKYIPRKFLILMLLWLSYCLLKLNFSDAFKISALFLGVGYLCLMDKEIYPKLKAAFYISCLFCIVQFVFYWINPTFSSSIAGSNLSATIWGEKLATPGYVNQYKVLFLPRMGGLSREAGFFASLVIIMALIIYTREKTNIKEKTIHLSAYIFSLSKVSFSNLIIVILFPFRKLINKIPLALTFIFISLTFILVAFFLKMDANHFGVYNESLAHRFSSSFLIPKMGIQEFLIGCFDYSTCQVLNNSNLINDLLDNQLYPNTGINGVFVDFGLLGFLLLIFSYWWLGLKSFDILILSVMTATVSVYTIDNFVILTYYFVFTYRKYFN